MLAGSIFLAIIIGVVRGGSITRLASFRLNFFWLIIIAFLLRIILPWLPGSPLERLRFFLTVISYLLLIWALFWNWREPKIDASVINWGIVLAWAGVVLNFLVISLNGGMPVSARAARIAGYRGDFVALKRIYDGIHLLMTPETKFAFLADIIPQPLGVASIGDIILALGVFIFIQNHMLYHGRHLRGRRGEINAVRSQESGVKT